MSQEWKLTHNSFFPDFSQFLIQSVRRISAAIFPTTPPHWCPDVQHNAPGQGALFSPPVFQRIPSPALWLVYDSSRKKYTVSDWLSAVQAGGNSQSECRCLDPSGSRWAEKNTSNDTCRKCCVGFFYCPGSDFKKEKLCFSTFFS